MELKALTTQVTSAINGEARPYEKPSSGEPNATAVQRFENALGDVNKDQTNLQSSAAIPSVQNIGGTILDGLEKIRATGQNPMKEIAEMGSSKEELSIGELLKMQVEVVSYTTELQLTSKIAESGNQGVQTLLRNQGG